MKVVKRQRRLESAGAAAVFVVHDEPELIRETMLADLDVPFPVLVDLDREAYTAWGLGRASLATIFLDPKVWRTYAKALGNGERLRRGGRDTLQLGGDFVVDAHGAVAYARPQRRDARPPVGELLEVVEGLPDRSG